MQPMNVTLNPTPDPDTAAAICAAVACVIAQAAVDELPVAPARSSWSAGAALTTQDMPPARNGAFAAWHAAERARRAEQAAVLERREKRADQAPVEVAIQN